MFIKWSMDRNVRVILVGDLPLMEIYFKATYS